MLGRIGIAENSISVKPKHKGSEQESDCAAAQSAFVFAIAVPEGQIGRRYNLFYLTGTKRFPLFCGEVSC